MRWERNFKKGDVIEIIGDLGNEFTFRTEADVKVYFRGGEKFIVMEQRYYPRKYEGGIWMYKLKLRNYKTLLPYFIYYEVWRSARRGQDPADDLDVVFGIETQYVCTPCPDPRPGN